MGADRTISTHAPRTGSDLFGLKQMQACQRDFNPRSPHGERLAHTAFFHHAPIFQPTLPARGATAFWGRMLPFSRHISTHAPRTGSDATGHAVFFPKLGDISTHAPRTGSDADTRRNGEYAVGDFNPRSPHGERQSSTSRIYLLYYFNPRSPHGERPAVVGGSNCFQNDFNPRSPHGERLTVSIWKPKTSKKFQPTLPARGATSPCPLRRQCRKFQPTLPARGATPMRVMALPVPIFQPTLPARGATWNATIRVPLPVNYFNPRSPHGERPVMADFHSFDSRFQPTLPARGATSDRACKGNSGMDFNPRSPHGERLTVYVAGKVALCAISTHAPRTGSDLPFLLLNASKLEFQPTLPARGATERMSCKTHKIRISTHAPRTGSDEASRTGEDGRLEFQPTLPARGATRDAGHAGR